MAVVKAKLRVPNQNSKVAPAANSVVPEYLRDVVGGLPTLLNAYYRWADIKGNFQGDSKLLLDYIDSKRTSPEILAFIKDTFLREFPDNTAASTKHVLMFAKDFYSTRGSMESYRFLFKALYNEELSIDYPGDFLFASSDGEWTQRTIMRIIYTDATDSIIGRRIYGISSGASAIVKELSVSASGYDLVADLVISQKLGKFLPDEIIETRDAGIKVTSRTVGAAGVYTIVSKGAGYKEGQTIPLVSTGDGAGFLARVGTTDQLGEILTIDIVSTGSGYTYSAPILDLTDIRLIDAAKPQFIPAQILISIDAEYEEGGRYNVLRSATSGAYKLQDGTFYQKFSYVIKTNVPLSKFDAVVKNLVHPAGTVMYAQPSINSNPGGIINNVGSILYHLSKPTQQNYRNTLQNSYRKFSDVDVRFSNNVNLTFDVTTISYQKFIQNFVLNKTLANQYSRYLISNILYCSMGDRDTHVYDNLTMSLSSSTKLDQIALIKLDDLVNTSKLYGLSTRVAYSNVSLLP